MTTGHPKLRVIEGGKTPLPEWLRFPQTVAAASPQNANEVVFYRIAVGDAIKAGRAGRRQPIFNLWSIVYGEPPPINNVETYNKPAKEGLTCLTQAHACFKGIKRPLDTDNNGEAIIAYVLRPTVHYVWQRNMACFARKQKVPREVVFVVYVRLDESSEDAVPSVGGIVTHWQFVKAEIAAIGDGRTEMLPIGSSERYDQRFW